MAQFYLYMKFPIWDLEALTMASYGSCSYTQIKAFKYLASMITNINIELKYVDDARIKGIEIKKICKP